MIHFIHTYTENSIDTLMKSSLVKKGHGLKIMNKPEFDETEGFNSAARENGRLHGLLEELSCHFYIDRLQGGLGNPKKYAYDKALIEHYKNSDKISFQGFQLHEWASNYRSDQQRIRELAEKEGVSPDDLSFREKIKNGELSVFLEAYTPEEWYSIPLSATREQFLLDCEALYKKRASETDGLIFPTDSYFMAYRTAIKNGAKMLLPEVGWQIPGMRLQLAYTRGMAKSAGLPWGIYYECWYCKDGIFTIPYSLKDSKDDWNESFGEKGFGNELPMEKRQYGGSSLSLMERAWVYAYFSGAEFLGEEYGICNTFYSVNSTKLSPYGEVKKRFIELTERYTPSGEIVKPVCVVIPREMELLDERLSENYLDYPPDTEGFFTKEYMRFFISSAESIFGINGTHGNMGHTLRSGGIADIAEIVHDDMEEAIDAYDYVIDLTGKNELKNSRDNVISVEEARKIADSLLPFTLPERLHVTIRRDEEGSEILIMNNDGILHEMFTPDVVIPEAEIRTEISLKSPVKLTKAEGTGQLTEENGSYFMTLRGGEWIILRVCD